MAEGEPRRDTLAFQVDHWNARGEFPRTMFEVMTREKGIRYSSRTRASTDRFKHVQRLRRCCRSARKVPRRAKEQPGGQFLRPAVDYKVYNIVHRIYRAKNHESLSKDYEFSRGGMEEHWRAGYHDAGRTLRHREVLQRPTNHEGVFIRSCCRRARVGTRLGEQKQWRCESKIMP